jgi:hypothetical protein
VVSEVRLASQQQMDVKISAVGKCPPPPPNSFEKYCMYAPAEVLEKAYKFPFFERNTSLSVERFNVYIPTNFIL